MSALLLQWVRTQRLQKKPPPPNPPWYWREWQQWSHGILLPHTKHWVAFVCVGGRRGGSPGSLSLSLRLVCECETPLLSGERNLSLVDSVGNDTISILGTAAAPDMRLVVWPGPGISKHFYQDHNYPVFVIPLFFSFFAIPDEIDVVGFVLGFQRMFGEHRSDPETTRSGL